MMNGFSKFHPSVHIVFYIAVLGLTMFQMQSGLVLVSLIGAITYYWILRKREGIKYFVLVFMIFIGSALINPLFSHRGATLLFYLPTGNPVTFESLIYGIGTALVISSVLLWFSTMGMILTQDKLIEAIGKGMPHFALLLSMIFRFIPKFLKQVRKIYFTQQALGENTKGLKNKLKLGIHVFSITLTWVLETSVDTADSMRARGYGIKRRTTYGPNQFTRRDYMLLVWILVCMIFVVCRLFMGEVNTEYYPYFRTKDDVGTYFVYFALCFTPIFIEIKETLLWHRLQSKI